MTFLLLAPPALVVLGLIVHRRKTPAPRAAMWAALVLVVAGADRLLAPEPPVISMLGILACAFSVVKVMVGEEEKRDGMKPLPAGRWLLFATLWIGMRPRLFAARRRGHVAGARGLAVRGATRLLAGLALLAAARRFGVGCASDVLLGAGLLLVFHFGGCTLLAAAWRAAGVRCDPIVLEPIRSRSLTEFWSKRWNLAYSEMCTILVFRPLAGRVGRGTAVLLVFLFSGLLHEMAISLPVDAGFGLPTLYFAAHGVLVLVEEALRRRGRPVGGVVGWLWTLLWVLGPTPLLFHRPFVTGVLRSLLPA
ncbi:MAG TPA: MBOAT family protein [Planctomycetota bacterium]|nr:MBOAT family protein [Planctomycetota bacterium]